jgi:hypothetical protein
MANAFIFANNVNTTLGASAASTATTLTLASSANLPTLASGQVMPLTLNDAATGLVYEIVYVTAISGATLTVIRAQEGTGAQNWNVGDYAACMHTAQSTASMNGSENQPFTVENLQVVGPGATTQYIQLNDTTSGAATPIKYIYSQAGSLHVKNSARSTTIFSLSDTGVGAFGGQVTGAPASGSSSFTTLGQVSATAPQYSETYYTPVSATTYTRSVTFTAPCAGFVLAASSINLGISGQPVACTNTISINGTAYGTDTTSNVMTNWGAVAVTSGQACTVTSTYAAGTSTGTFGAVSQTVISIFIPNP